MKKQIIFIWAAVLALFLYTAPCQAAYSSPFLLDAAELSAPQVARSGVNLLIPASATSHIPSTGSASSAGIARNMIARVGGFKGIATVGLLAVAGYAAWVEAHPSDYPISYGLLHPGLPSANKYAVGAVISTPYGNKKIISSSYTTGLISVTTQNYYGATSANIYERITFAYGNYWQGKIWTISYAPTTDPVPSDRVSDQVFTQSLDQLYPTVSPEVDKYIQANPSAVQVPSTLPAEVARQAAIDAQRQSLLDRIAALQQIKDAAQARYNADPTEENRLALHRAIADLEDAESNLEDLDKEVTDNDSAAPPPTPEYDELNFQPLQDLGEELGDKFPFTLLATLKNFAMGLVATPQAPTFNIEFPAPFNYTWHVSLERFDNIARMVRVLIGMAFLAYVTMALLRRFH